MSFQSKSKTGVIQSQHEGKESTRSRKAIAKGKLNPKVMGMFKTPRTALMRQAMEKIALAPVHQKSIRRRDPKAIYRYYDRNQSIHQMMKCVNNKKAEGTGTCGMESLKRMEEFDDTREHMRVQLRLSCEEFPGHPKKSVNHYATIWKDENPSHADLDPSEEIYGKWRYESYGNGCHMDIRLCDKLQNQKVLSLNITRSNLEMTDEFEILEIFRLWKEDWSGNEDFSYGFCGDKAEEIGDAAGAIPYAAAYRKWRKDDKPKWLN